MLVEPLLHIVEGLQDLPRDLVIPLAVGGQRKPMSRTVEEWRTQRLLESGDELRDGRGRDVARSRGSGETAMLDGTIEIMDGTQLVHRRERTGEDTIISET
jgi:hypothetical protein